MILKDKAQNIALKSINLPQIEIFDENNLKAFVRKKKLSIASLLKLVIFKFYKFLSLIKKFIF